MHNITAMKTVLIQANEQLKERRGFQLDTASFSMEITTTLKICTPRLLEGKRFFGLPVALFWLSGESRVSSADFSPKSILAIEKEMCETGLLRPGCSFAQHLSETWCPLDTTCCALFQKLLHCALNAVA
jgi:hypothetical protein